MNQTAAKSSLTSKDQAARVSTGTEGSSSSSPSKSRNSDRTRPAAVSFDIDGNEKGDSLTTSLGKSRYEIDDETEQWVQGEDEDDVRYPQRGKSMKFFPKRIEATVRTLKTVIFRQQSSAASSLFSSSQGLSMKDQKKTLASRVNDAELLEVLDPFLLECPARGFCYAVPPVFRLATMSACTAFLVLVITYLLPLASFLLDIIPFLGESGRKTCIVYTTGRTVLFVLLSVVSVWFMWVHTKLHKCFVWRWKLEQIFVLTACLTLVFENASKLSTRLSLYGVIGLCDDEFKMSDWANLRFFRILNFCFNYLMFEVSRSFTTGIGPIGVVFAVSFAETVFVLKMGKPENEEDKQAFNYSAGLFESIRIFFVAHKGYLAYMELSKRSYLRTRSRQLAFWIMAGPVVVHSLLFVCGRPSVILYSLVDTQHKLRLNTFVGEAFVTEFKYLLFAFLFAAPSQDPETEPVRIVRTECSSESAPAAKDKAQSSKRRRNNIFGSFGLESEARQKGLALRPTFCLETALWAFNCSYLVYFDEPSSGSDCEMLEEDLETARLRVRKFFVDYDSTNCVCIFSSVDQPWRIFVSFRGTASLSHVATDVSAWAKLVEFGREQEKFWVHQGFNRAFKRVGPIIRIELHSYVKKLMKNGTSSEIISITFCGHSLGGALATLMAVDSVDGLRELGISDCKVYTFGAPRVGDSAFASYANSKITHIFRIVGSADPIPRIPGKRVGLLLVLVGLPLWLKIRSMLFSRNWQVLLFYRHVGYEVCVNRQATGDIVIDPVMTDLLFFMNWLPVATDHLFTAYRAAMFASIFYLKGEDEPSDLAAPKLMDTE